MKTARRHELRENELALHIETLGDTLRRHGPMLGVVAGVVIVAMLGVRFYRGYQQGVRADAWKLIGQNPAAASKSLEEGTTQLQELADRNISPAISKAALQRVLMAGMAGMMQAGIDGKPEQGTRAAERVKSAAEQLKSRFGDDAAAVASADMALGFLAEQRGDYDAAKKIYQAVKSEPRFASLPLTSQATYRLDHLDTWKTPVVFAPPLPPASAPAAAAASGPAPVIRLGGFDPAGGPKDVSGAANTLLEPVRTIPVKPVNQTPATQPSGAP